jgi:hypothetical protein
MQSVIVGDVLDMKPLDCLKGTFVLSDAAKSNAKPIVKARVGDADVRAIGLEGYAVITVIHGPVVELDV